MQNENAPQDPRLFLTSMSHGGVKTLQNAREIIEPIHGLVDGIVWVLHDTPMGDPAARYLESVKGAGRVVHRAWPGGRHFHSMNDTLWSGAIREGDLVLWVDPLERPMPEFLKKIKSDIWPLMQEAEVECIFYYGKPFLFTYSEVVEYRNTPHWTLTGLRGRVLEWSTIEPDETKVRFNARPQKRTDPLHFVSHYLRYFVEYPEGANSALLGLDHWPGGMTKENWVKRETNRLNLRLEMRKRGFPLTVDGFVSLCRAGLDDQLKEMLGAEKTFSDAYHHLVNGRTDIKDSHNPADAIPL